MEDVIFGLGANVGDPQAQLAAAVRMLGEFVEITAVSSVYRTEPAGFRDQPDFFNLVVVGSSALPPEALLAGVARIERELGRVRSFANAPRTIDIDILAHGGGTVHTPDLDIPHPRLHERAFVLAPLAEVAPTWRHPILGLTAAEMLAALESHGRIERVGDLPAAS